MKLLTILILLSASNCFAFGGSMGGPASAPPVGDPVWYGWPNADGVPEAITMSTFGSTGPETCYTRDMADVADGIGGTVTHVNAYVNTASGQELYAAVWRGTTQIGRSVDIQSSAATSWTGEIEVVAVNGESLDYVNSDDIKAGLCWHYAPPTPTMKATTPDTTTISFNNTGGWIESYPPATFASWSGSSSKALAVILRTEE